jgi:hypothetical protein
MTRRLETGTPLRDADGVSITADPRTRKHRFALVAASAAGALALAGLVRLLAPAASLAPAPLGAQEEAGAAAAQRAHAAGAAAAARAGARVRVARKAGAVAPTRAGEAHRDAGRPAASDEHAPGAGPGAALSGAGGPLRDDSPTHEEPAFTIGPPGSGIDVFPKPGTDPLKLGLVVPDDFELPEGYVRHFQVTDDGRTLEPILMFHPDYEFFDENGRPIELPADLVVPPELAPPGFPLRPLEPPAPVVPGAEPPPPGAGTGDAP